MMGFIIIEGDIDQIPGIAGVPERLLMLQRVITTNGVVPELFPGSGLGSGKLLVNGADTPVMFIRSGETQRWRLCNGSVSSLVRLSIEGHSLTLIAQDGNTLARAATLSTLDMATAQRREILVQGGRPGVYRVQFRDLQGPFATPGPLTDLAYLVVTGAEMEPQPLPTTLLPFVDLRNLPLTAPPREIALQMIGDPNAPTFAGQGWVIDGQAFDINRIDQVAALGATEEWTVFNETEFIHPFHIHINPFQVTKINGQPYDALSYEDTTSVPARAGGSGSARGSITFRTRFLDFPGKWVYHCHILGHEDGGMMGTILVT